MDAACAAGSDRVASNAGTADVMPCESMGAFTDILEATSNAIFTDCRVQNFGAEWLSSEALPCS